MAPALVSVTAVIVISLSSVLVVNSFPANVNVDPTHLLLLLAKMVIPFGVILAENPVGCFT